MVRQADAVQPAAVLFDVFLVSVLGFSLFRPCAFKSNDERCGIATPVSLGGLEIMPRQVGFMYGFGDTLSKSLSHRARIRFHFRFRCHPPEPFFLSSRPLSLGRSDGNPVR